MGETVESLKLYLRCGVFGGVGVRGGRRGYNGKVLLLDQIMIKSMDEMVNQFIHPSPSNQTITHQRPSAKLRM